MNIAILLASALLVAEQPSQPPSFSAQGILYPEDSPKAPPDCSGDWADAINERLRFERNPGATYGDSGVPDLLIGRDCQEYKVTKPIHVFGARISGIRPLARIRCDNVNGACIRGHYPDTVVGPGTYQKPGDPFSGSAGPLLLEYLTIRGTLLSGSVGISPRWGFTAKHVLVERFDVGVDLTCTARPTPPATPSNCNLFYMERVRAQANLGHGFHLKGADVNAGIAIAIVSDSNGGWGWWSDSFLGNTIIQPHFANNQDGAIFISGVSARSVVIGAYVENSQAPGDTVDVRFPSTVIQATGGRFASGAVAIRDGNRVHGGFDFIDEVGLSTHRVGGSPNVYSAMGVQGDPHPVRMKHQPGIGWLIDHANLGTRQALIVTTNTSPAALPRGRAWFRFGALHGPTALRAIYVASALQLPDPSSMPLGSRAWSTAPEAGEPAFWVLVSSPSGPRWSPIVAP